MKEWLMNSEIVSGQRSTLIRTMSTFSNNVQIIHTRMATYCQEIKGKLIFQTINPQVKQPYCYYSEREFSLSEMPLSDGLLENSPCFRHSYIRILSLQNTVLEHSLIMSLTQF